MSTEKKRTSQTDYLNKCPNEIWLEIFTTALVPFSGDVPYRLQTLTLDTYSKPGTSHTTQKSRFQLLTLSKKLYPLLEQLLFRDVILRGPTQYKRFIDRARTQSSDHKNRGDWTRALKVYSGYRHSVPTSLHAIMLACPNLRLLEIGSMVDINLGKTMEMDDWSSNIRYLHWSNCDLTWEHLHKLSTQLPQLTQLGLMGCDEDIQCNSIITFLRVQHFEVSSDCTENIDISRLRMPSLESLTVEVGQSDRIYAFLKQHGPRIKVLEFVPWENLTDPLDFAAILDGFFTVFSALEQFTFIPSMFEPLEISGEVPAASSSLQTLRMAVYDSDEFIEQHAEYFSYDRFPNISRIIAVPGWGKPEETHSSLKSLFPHATIEWDNDSSSNI